jgi:hypothetical protein
MTSSASGGSGIRTQAPGYFAVRGHDCEWPMTCDADSPTVTARARRGPAVSDAVRTQRGPATSRRLELVVRQPPVSPEPKPSAGSRVRVSWRCRHPGARRSGLDKPCRSGKEELDEIRRVAHVPASLMTEPVKRSSAAVGRARSLEESREPEKVLAGGSITLTAIPTPQTFSQTVKCSRGLYSRAEGRTQRRFHWSEPVWWARQGLNL